jgi:acetyl-CoA carboxylase biotin carboxylase subunit
VTEVVTGIDIVREQLRIASGLPLSVSQDEISVRGHAIECRINAEAADRGFAPTPGLIEAWEVPEADDVRVDTHCFAGYDVPPFYDSLLAKVIVRGDTREAAFARLSEVLPEIRIDGIETTLRFHESLARDSDVLANRLNTKWLEDVFMSAPADRMEPATLGGVI